MPSSEGGMQGQGPFADSHDIPIARLDTTAAPPSHVSITAVVALIFPFSSHTQTAAVLLADPDMRQRSKKGQVRVQFHGAAAVAFGSSRIGSGDKIRLLLEGAQWVEEDKLAVHTPGRSVDKELVFERRLVLRATREGVLHAALVVDAPAALRSAPADDEDHSFRSSSESSPGMDVVTPAVVRARSRMNLGFDASAETELGPIVFDDDDYDPFVVDDDDGHQPRKRTKLGRRSGEWKLVGWGDERRSPRKDVAGSPVRASKPLSEVLPASPMKRPIIAVPEIDTSFVDLISPDADDTLKRTPLGAEALAGTSPDAGQHQSLTAMSDGDELSISQEVNAGHSSLDNQAKPITLDEVTSLTVPAEQHPALSEIHPETPPAEPLRENPKSPRTPTATFAAVEPLFGPGIPISPANNLPAADETAEEVLEHQPEILQTLEDNPPLFDGTQQQVFVIDDEADETGQADQALQLEQRQESPESLAVRSSATRRTSSLERRQSPEAEIEKLGSALSLGELPQLSTTFAHPQPWSEEITRPGTPSRRPPSPSLRPQPSSELPLVSPFPTSNALSSDFPTSSAQSFQLPSSTPATSVFEWQWSQPVLSQDTEESLIEDPGAPPDTTLMDVDVEGFLKFNPEHFDPPTQNTAIDPSLVDFASQTLNTTIEDQADTMQPSFGDIQTIDDLEVVETGTSPTQILEKPKEVSEPNMDVDDEAHAISNVLEVSEVTDQAQEVVLDEMKSDMQPPHQRQSQGPEVHESSILAESAKSPEPQASTPREARLSSSSRRPSRSNLVPEVLSPFFELRPPRRSGRQAKATEKVRPETQDLIAAPSPPVTSAGEGELTGGPENKEEDDFSSIGSLRPGIPNDSAHRLRSQSTEADNVNAVKPVQVQTSRRLRSQSIDEAAAKISSNATNNISKKSDELVSLINGRSRGFRTQLSYYAALENIDVYLNASSSENHSSLFDIFAVVTEPTSDVVRAKAGPKDHYTIMELTDASLSNQEVRAECFRPRKDALPLASVGDVILLREPGVRSRDGSHYLLSGSTSAWHVWKFSTLDEKANSSSFDHIDMVVPQECRGPQVEIGSEEQEHALALRAWWLSVRADWQPKKPNKTSRKASGRVSEKSERQNLATKASSKNKLVSDAKTSLQDLGVTGKRNRKRPLRF
ncbi:hypothetical protein FH972_024662 [Carpinus fangiana]|uniref:Telomeric single stranded DNA binding POT1/Cdc13 domain-containing protein n=1 Tax=Carpinus fangiana TaxID=176857 RepID=A0A5N6KZ18_9ROSI|nr:hypothetical protein FH972_024662 [Carpinus fangiana]